MTFSVTNAPQLANAAGRGNLHALRTLLLDIIDHVDGLSSTELGYIDGVTPGTVAASKAVVVDASVNATWPGILTLSSLVNTQARITTLTGALASLTAAAVTTLTGTAASIASAGITTLTGTVATLGTAGITTLTGTVGTLATAGITTLTGVTGGFTTGNVTHARVGMNATQGTFAAFGVTPVSQLAAITGGGVTAVTITNAAGFATTQQGNALVAAVADMRAKFQSLGWALTSAPS